MKPQIYQHLELSQVAKLKELLTEHLRGFREASAQFKRVNDFTQ